MAAAIAGRTPLYGLHLDENRVPGIEVKIQKPLSGYEYAALGFLVGRFAGDRIPLFRGVKLISEEELKLLGAALACSGGIPLFHIEGITPEAKLNPKMKASERYEVEADEIGEVCEELNDHDVDPDLIFIGCPHASIRELIMFLELLGDRVAKRRTWIFTSRTTRDLGERLGVVEKLESLGVKVVCDTCPIVAPIRELGVRSIATNSAKGAWFSRNLNGLKIRFMPIEGLVELAVK